MDLSDDFGGIEVAPQADASGFTEGAAHRAADLATDAEGGPASPHGHKNRFDATSIGQTKDGFGGPLFVIGQVLQAQRSDLPGDRLPQRPTGGAQAGGLWPKTPGSKEVSVEFGGDARTLGFASGLDKEAASE